ncbi:MAG: ferrous iron transport protein B [Megasphaera sp.]|jgi:ferrous iron transport protein B|nr:ferrous iron transport protein B [Megasphaera sp.]MCH4187221.1 ferrous iron transport protein B [Megasphaera sp.]MCH4217495.1 ferrous iron transport protein B [Megasphaera sp.]
MRIGSHCQSTRKQPVATAGLQDKTTDEMTVAFIGNPNCGKTTLFNAYTGANLKVANWPGVTVEKVEGAIESHGVHLHLVDLPGTYSLTSYTMEEQVSRNFILSDEVDVIVDVVDASALERNLYLTLQLLELGKPVVIALNMMDIIEKRGMEIDLHRLPEMLGVPVIPVSALKRRGLSVLLHAAIHHKDHVHPDRLIHNHSGKTHHRHNHHSEFAMVYSDELEDKIDAVRDMLHSRYPDVYNHRWHALKLLEKDTEITKKFPVDDVKHVIDRSYETDIINQKYAFIEEIIHECVVNQAEKAASTDYVDQILTNRWLSIPVFLAIMGLVFFLTFFVGNILQVYFEGAINFVSDGATAGLTAIGADDMVISLVCDGIIAGVGSILTFLPNICILFFSLALLEDSGYMSRVAFIMNDIMNRLGLSGRAFIPMILGFGCSVPAIMASRALENKTDRYRTMLVTPFMSCSARLPIYILFSGMFFPANAMIVAYSMYLIGIIVALAALLTMNLIKKQATENALLIELPEYKRPSGRTVFIYVWEKVKDYLGRAGTIIFAASIIMWFILNFGPDGYGAMTNSFGALIGKGIVPFFAPIGLGYWQISLALIAGISAKEVVVSSFAVLFDGVNINSPVALAALAGTMGQAGFTPLNAYCMMLFSLLYIPCAATIATIHAESHSWKWTVFSVVFQIAVAWILTFIVYQIGSLLF